MTNTTTVVEKGKNGEVDATSAKIENLKNSGIDVDGSITKFVIEVLGGLNENTKKDIETQVKKYLEEHKNDDDFDKKIDDIHKVCEKIFGVKVDNNGNLVDAPKTTVKKESEDKDNSTETGGDKPTENGNKKQVELGLKGTLSNIEELGTDENGSPKQSEGKFYDNGKKADTPPDWVSNVNTNIQSQLDPLTTLLGDNSKHKEDEGLKNAGTLLEEIQKIIKNPIESNVKVLQQYILSNIDNNWEIPENMKDGNENETYTERFKRKNKYNENKNQFDGKFGNSTLNGLNKVLDKTGRYIDSFKSPAQQENADTFKNVTVKSEIDLPTDKEVEEKDLLEGVSDDIQVTFKDNKGIDKNKTEEQKVKIVLTKDGETKEITLIVKVEDNKLKIKEEEKPTEPEQSTQPLDTTPLQTPDGKQHQVLENSQTIAQNTRLQGATFYSPDAFTGNAPTDGTWEAVSIQSSGDYECLMKMGKDIYRVKVDQSGHLHPLIENAASGAKILIKNNPSCIDYLQNKIPATRFSEQPRIAWNPSMQDYVIRSYDRGLTIEPMTLDGNWVSKDLRQCLAFENLTNFLRGNGNIDNLEFKNDNPNLKLENDGLYVRIKKGTRLADNSKSDEWYKIDLSEFGINNNPEALKKFIKYNNREDWKDNWDKKSLNKGYTKVDFPAVQVAVGVGNPSANAPQASNNISQVSNNGSPSTSNKPTAGQPTVVTNATTPHAEGEKPT